MRVLRRRRSQNGAVPATSRNDGAKIDTSAIVPPSQPFGALRSDAPRNAENVNSGPGTACATPYPARNAASPTQPGATTAACSSGSTT